MAAEATFTLRAVDATKQAFASVQNSLQKIQSQSQAAGTVMNKVFGARQIGTALATALGVNLTTITDKISRFVTGQSEETQKLQDELISLGDEAINSAKALYIARNTDEQNLKSLVIIQTRLNALIAKPVTDLQSQVDSMRAQNSLYQVELQILNATGKIEDEKKKSLEEATKVFQDYEQAQNQVNQTRKDARTSLASEIDQQKMLDEELIKVGTSIRDLKSALGGDITGENLLNLDLSVATKEDLKMLNDLTAKLNEYNGLLGKRKRIETDLDIIAKHAGDIIASGFEDAIFSGKKLGEVIKAIGLDLMRMVFQQTVTAPLAKGISTAIIAGFRANGGPVSGGSPYVVGERGPELFIPNGSGSIVSNSSMNQDGGSTGSSVNVNYNIAAGVTRNELAPILEQERRRLKAEIPDMVRRGGAYRSAFA